MCLCVYMYVCPWRVKAWINWANLSMPHTSMTSLRTCVCMFACLLACTNHVTDNFKSTDYTLWPVVQSHSDDSRTVHVQCMHVTVLHVHSVRLAPQCHAFIQYLRDVHCCWTINCHILLCVVYMWGDGVTCRWMDRWVGGWVVSGCVDGVEWVCRWCGWIRDPVIRVHVQCRWGGWRLCRWVRGWWYVMCVLSGMGGWGVFVWQCYLCCRCCFPRVTWCTS